MYFIQYSVVDPPERHWSRLQIISPHYAAQKIELLSVPIIKLLIVPTFHENDCLNFFGKLIHTTIAPILCRREYDVPANATCTKDLRSQYQAICHHDCLWKQNFSNNW